MFEFPQRIGADDVEFTIELSGDLEDWQSGGTSFLGQSERNGEITTSRWAITAGAVGRQFARLAVALRQP